MSGNNSPDTEPTGNEDGDNTNGIPDSADEGDEETKVEDGDQTEDEEEEEEDEEDNVGNNRSNIKESKNLQIPVLLKFDPNVIDCPYLVACHYLSSALNINSLSI